MPARISSRCSASSGWLTPPGTTQPGWMRLPPRRSMICWPNLRSAMPSRASWGAASATPMRLRPAGSVSKPEQQIGRRQVEEAQGVGLDDLGQVHHPAQAHGDRRDGDGQDLVARLGRGDQVADRADAADAGHQRRHLVERAPLADPLEAPELRDVEMGVDHLAAVVELDGDPGVALDPSDRVDDDLRHLPLRLRRRTARWWPCPGPGPASSSSTTKKIWSAVGGQPGRNTSTSTTCAPGATAASSLGTSGPGSWG